MPIPLDAGLAEVLASTALGHVAREYPNKLDHVLNDSGEVKSPHELHPVFFGSFDWHSCVHAHWLLVRISRQFPHLALAGDIRMVIDRHWTEPAMAAECAYLQEPSRRTFERPYGWAWLLKLSAELSDWDHPDGARWSERLKPLADIFADWFLEFLPKSNYPNRSGTHGNSAFALTLALDYAGGIAEGTLDALIREKAEAWFGGDRDCQAWEPGGDDFLSPALMEAELMHRVLPAGEFVSWLDKFLPRWAEGQPATLFTPATVTDPTDGKIAHLDGLNLSRAWCWRALSHGLPPGDPRTALAEQAADLHLKASIQAVCGEYAGEHWLATFALLALEA